MAKEDLIVDEVADDDLEGIDCEEEGPVVPGTRSVGC